MIEVFTCTEFSYNWRYASEFKIKVVNVNTGIQTSPYATKRKAIYDKIPYNPNVFYYGVDTEPFTFTLHLASIDDHGNLMEWTERKRREVAKWLMQPTYRPFISADNPDLIYYAMITEESKISLGMAYLGYLEVTFECNSAFPFSKTLVHDYDFRFNDNPSEPFTFDINNISNDNSSVPSFMVELYIPKFSNYDDGQEVIPNGGDYPSWSTIPPSTDLKYIIRNTRNTKPLDDNGNQNGFMLSTDLFPSVPLRQGETVVINMSMEDVQSFDNWKTLEPGYKYRIRNTNEKWINLEWGHNEIEVVGACVLRVYTIYPILR